MNSSSQQDLSNSIGPSRSSSPTPSTTAGVSQEDKALRALYRACHEFYSAISKFTVSCRNTVTTLEAFNKLFNTDDLDSSYFNSFATELNRIQSPFAAEAKFMDLNEQAANYVPSNNEIEYILTAISQSLVNPQFNENLKSQIRCIGTIEQINAILHLDNNANNKSLESKDHRDSHSKLNKEWKRLNLAAGTIEPTQYMPRYNLLLGAIIKELDTVRNAQFEVKNQLTVHQSRIKELNKQVNYQLKYLVQAYNICYRKMEHLKQDITKLNKDRLVINRQNKIDKKNQEISLLEAAMKPIKDAIDGAIQPTVINQKLGLSTPSTVVLIRQAINTLSNNKISKKNALDRLAALEEAAREADADAEVAAEIAKIREQFKIPSDAPCNTRERYFKQLYTICAVEKRKLEENSRSDNDEKKQKYCKGINSLNLTIQQLTNALRTAIDPNESELANQYNFLDILTTIKNEMKKIIPDSELVSKRLNEIEGKARGEEEIDAEIQKIRGSIKDSKDQQKLKHLLDAYNHCQDKMTRLEKDPGALRRFFKFITFSQDTENQRKTALTKVITYIRNKIRTLGTAQSQSVEFTLSTAISNLESADFSASGTLIKSLEEIKAKASKAAVAHIMSASPSSTILSTSGLELSVSRVTMESDIISSGNSDNGNASDPEDTAAAITPDVTATGFSDVNDAKDEEKLTILLKSSPSMSNSVPSTPRSSIVGLPPIISAPVSSITPPPMLSERYRTENASSPASVNEVNLIAAIRSAMDVSENSSPVSGTSSLPKTPVSTTSEPPLLSQIPSITKAFEDKLIASQTALEETKAALNNVTEQLKVKENELKVATNQCEIVSHQLQGKDSELKKITDAHNGEIKKLDDLSAKLLTVEAELKQKTEALQQVTKVHETKEKQLEQITAECKENATKLNEAIAECARVKNQLTEKDSKLTQMTDKYQREIEESQTLNANLTEVKVQLEATKEQLNKATLQQREADDTANQVSNEIKQITAEHNIALQALQQEVSRLKLTIDTCNAEIKKSAETEAALGMMKAQPAETTARNAALREEMNEHKKVTNENNAKEGEFKQGIAVHDRPIEAQPKTIELNKLREILDSYHQNKGGWRKWFSWLPFISSATTTIKQLEALYEAHSPAGGAAGADKITEREVINILVLRDQRKPMTRRTALGNNALGFFKNEANPAADAVKSETDKAIERLARDFNYRP